MKCFPILLLLLATAPVAARDLSPIVDPPGDATDTFGAGPPLHDLDRAEFTYDATHLHFRITANDDFTAPSAGDSSTAFVCVVGLDTDQNVSTGQPPVQNLYSPPLTSLPLGCDWLIDVSYDEIDPGFAELVLLTEPSARVWPRAPHDRASVQGSVTIPVTFTARTVSGSIPLTTLGDDGIVDFAVSAGSWVQPTDALGVVGTSVETSAVERVGWGRSRSAYR